MNYKKTADANIFYLKFLQALMVCDNVNDFLREAKELGDRDHIWLKFLS